MNDQKKFYLTKGGMERIKNDYQNIKNAFLSKIKGGAPKMLQSEDPNPEYLSFQEDIDLFESRISELENIIKNAELIKMPPKEKRGTVGLGATVTLEDAHGRANQFTIVGTLESNPDEGKISSESPVGSAILGKNLGSEVVITSPLKAVYKIKDIKYQVA